MKKDWRELKDLISIGAACEPGPEETLRQIRTRRQASPGHLRAGHVSSGGGAGTQSSPACGTMPMVVVEQPAKARSPEGGA
jgi:hypothetical protein